MTDQTSFADIVKARREALSMTQSVLAGAAGLTERTVQRVERGESPSRETVMALCSVLSIAQTTAHAALRQSPPNRSSDDDTGVFEGRVTTALPPAHGPVAEGERSLAIAKLVRSGNRFEAITGPDLTAMAHELISEEDLRGVGMKWTDGDCEEMVIEEGRKRSTDNPLRKLVQWCKKGQAQDDDFGPLLIIGVLAFGHGMAIVMTVKAFFGEMWSNATIIALSLAGIAALLGWLMETSFEIAQKKLSRHWVMGIGRDVLAISRVRTNGIDVVEAAQVVRCSIERKDRHLTFSYTAFDGSVHDFEYLPDVPQVRSALESFENTVRGLSSIPVALEPVHA